MKSTYSQELSWGSTKSWADVYEIDVWLQESFGVHIPYYNLYLKPHEQSEMYYFG